MPRGDPPCGAPVAEGLGYNRPTLLVEEGGGPTALVGVISGTLKVGGGPSDVVFSPAGGGVGAAPAGGADTPGGMGTPGGIGTPEGIGVCIMSFREDCS